MMSFIPGVFVFALAVALLAYVPGRLMLSALRINLSPLETLALSSVVGLIASDGVYWVLVYFGYPHLFVAWPLVSVVLFCYFQFRLSKNESWSSREQSPPSFSGGRDTFLNLSGFMVVVGLGVAVLALLPQFYPNLTWNSDGTIRVNENPDLLLHIALANELTHTIPPQIPIFAGYAMSYHYGMDLCIAMFATASHLTVPDLAVRFIPTLFLFLAMAGVFCFSRVWLRSPFFAALVVFLVFFGEDFSFLPGFLFHEKVDWSIHYFGVPATFALFQANPMLPGIGLLFWGLFCLQKYHHAPKGTWCFLAALLFAASAEVKIFIAFQILSSLALTAGLYFLLYRKTNLLKVGMLTGCLLLPLVMTFLNRNTEALIAISLNPWPYVSDSLKALHLEGWFNSRVAFACFALPLYLLGSFGLRIIGFPALGRALFRPRRNEALRFCLASFVVIGVLLTLTLRIVPPEANHPYNNSVWFFGQSKHVAWIFAAEALVTVHNFMVSRGARVTLSSVVIALVSISLSAPSTVQHLILAIESSKHRNRSYGKEIMEVTGFLAKKIKPGDVVLPCGELLAPVLALLPARVPIGYFANTFVAQTKYQERLEAQQEFWRTWQLGTVDMGYLTKTNVRYLISPRKPQPSSVPRSGFVQIFQNATYCVFQTAGTSSGK